ncbi:hypothetical protein PVAND_011920 [Polypedilum vanderplanki]|uniref:Phenoloxidase-activating factor 2 n=1 Tax=Polypedilum vanderplanki TaxID=319348 RepID=A0A9J6CL42_POLVA|nr:hypothetical protein PVAND_011920 [Polypedilum vanderplanki]
MKIILLLVLIKVISTRAADDSLSINTQQIATNDDNSVKLCNNGLGECVSFYLCKNGSFLTDGSDILDIRIDDDDGCNDIFLTCCGSAEISSKNQSPPGLNMINEKCGYRNKNGVGFQITGSRDNETEFGEFPFMLALLNEEKISDQVISVFQCGASLITERVALTAAHCVFNKTFDYLKIRAGEWDTSTNKETFPYAEYKVQDIIIHENFNHANLRNDLALLIIENTVKIAENVNTICLPPQDYKFEVGKKCFASGWGKNLFGREGKYQNILKKIYVPLVSFEECQDKLRLTRLGKRFILDNSFICAGDENHDACKGDGGGPLFCEIDNFPGYYYQIGIISWGIGCNSATPGVYVNVAHFRTWIDSQLQARNLSKRGYIIDNN